MARDGNLYRIDPKRLIEVERSKLPAPCAELVGVFLSPPGCISANDWQNVSPSSNIKYYFILFSMS